VPGRRAATGFFQKRDLRERQRALLSGINIEGRISLRRRRGSALACCDSRAIRPGFTAVLIRIPQAPGRLGCTGRRGVEKERARLALLWHSLG